MHGAALHSEKRNALMTRPAPRSIVVGMLPSLIWIKPSSDVSFQGHQKCQRMAIFGAVADRQLRAPKPKRRLCGDRRGADRRERRDWVGCCLTVFGEASGKSRRFRGWASLTASVGDKMVLLLQNEDSDPQNHVSFWDMPS